MDRIFFQSDQKSCIVMDLFARYMQLTNVIPIKIGMGDSL